MFYLVIWPSFATLIEVKGWEAVARVSPIMVESQP